MNTESITFPSDIFSMILNIRSEEMKKDKELKENKEFFKLTVIKDLNFLNTRLNDGIYIPHNETFSKQLLDYISCIYNEAYEADEITTQLFGCWCNDRYDC
tara:strand:+ start:925 stop:1227 length:303 start_codon:yes stop_codon:yes gene_type:complete